jgi:hypothetical protein
MPLLRQLDLDVEGPTGRLRIFADLTVVEQRGQIPRADLLRRPPEGLE